MTKQLVAQLYSSDEEVKRAAIYRVLFDRRHGLLPELKKAASFEQNEEIAVFMVQVGLTLEAFPRDPSIERRIIELLQRDDGAGLLSVSMWKYLMNSGSSQMLIAALAAMGDAIPPDAQEFIEASLNHADPDIRAMACAKAIKSGRPTHFAYVLNLITDPDPIVAATAFSAVQNMPVNELAIILDYALGSPDEWVLQNVAPFLPLMINNGLRQVISKVQYHKHPLVSRKAREALKKLDSNPYVSKRKRADAELLEAATAKEAVESAECAKDAEPTEKPLSFKEQMEIKRLQKLAEERRIQQEDEELAAELAKVKPEDMANFADEITEFDNLASGAGHEQINFADEVVEEDELAQFTNFEDQAAILACIEVEGDEPLPEAAAIDFYQETKEVKEALPVDFSAADKQSAAPIIAQAAGVPPKLDGEADSQKNSLITKPTQDAAANSSDGTDSEELENFDFQVIDLSAQLPVTEAIDFAKESATPAATSAATPALAADDTEPINEIDLSGDDMEIQIFDENAPEQATQAHDDATDKTPDKTPDKAPAIEQPRPIQQPQKPAVAVARPQPQIVVVPSAAREIIDRYPSFLTDPLQQLFQPTRHDVQLKIIGTVVDNLLAFLNLCYLQSCLFFAPEADILNKSIKECIKGHLIGPTALRCLHNFALAMKKTHSNPVFFTFSLAGVLSESSDTNPLMMMRELKEFLRNPVMPLDESIPQAIDGLIEILRGVKSIVNNSLVMKAPPGAKQPFADLSGPEARILPADKRPGLDLPIGEVVLLSRDGTEALGLFPYFKYARKKIVFARPDDKEIAILLERLEISLDQV